MEPSWVLKRDPVHHPVRFLAGLWQQNMMANFGGVGSQLTPKELGQMKSLKKYLGDLTQDVIGWMLNPVNWWHFCQQVRAESGLHTAPPDPHIGFLLRHHTRALKIMRWELRDSTAPAHIDSCTRLDRLRYEEWKALALVYADGIAERSARIEKAKTLIDVQRVFIELVDESIPVSIATAS
jgi:hypothetical protein